MKVLKTYIAKHILFAILLITLMLIALQTFILVVNQLQDIGKGNFTLAVAVKVALLQLPYQIYLFFPMASLLGVLMGLGILANHRELVVMRAAGVSLFQITMAVFRAAILVIVVLTIFGETLVPKMTLWAADLKMQSLSGGQALRTSHGMWLRLQHDFIFIGSVGRHHELQDVMQFHFDQHKQLRFIRRSARVEQVNGQWQAFDGLETDIGSGHVSTQKFSRISWDLPIKPGVLKISNIEPDQMTLVELYQFLRLQALNQQNVSNYVFVFWQRLTQPFAILVMMLLGIPFIFGPLRSSTMGAKMVMGTCCGFAFYTLAHLLGSVIQVFQWSPELGVLLPLVVFSLLGIGLMRRVY